MCRPLGKGHLQAVVIGFILIRQAVDLRYVREFVEVRALRLCHASCLARVTSYGLQAVTKVICWDRAGVRYGKCGNTISTAPRNFAQRGPSQSARSQIRRAQRRLVDVPETQQFSAVVANIGDLQGHVVCDRLLDGQRPCADVGGSQIRIHILRVARRRISYRSPARVLKALAVAALDRKKAGGEDAPTRSSSPVHTAKGLTLPTRRKVAAADAALEYTHVARTRPVDLSAAIDAGVRRTENLRCAGRYLT